MAAIDELIEQIDNPMLRERITKEVRRMAKQKKFGLVFEEHLPERTLLYEVPVKLGSLVACNSDVNNIYQVIKIKEDKAVCIAKTSKEQKEIPVSELVSVAEFGEPIYPYLEPLDSVENAPNNGLWHTLIEADNYHALQLLDYMYHGKVDCIYIDPPYNNRANDWKYNNDYVDSNDSYRHSKWLSMMKKRLYLAKKLLNPKESVLMITIDDIELAHLRVLLDHIFPSNDIQIIDVVINPKGKARVGRLSQVDEYLIMVYIGNASTIPEENKQSGEEIRWPYLRRSDIESARGTVKGGVKQFYPIYVNPKTKKIVHLGDYLTPEQSLDDIDYIPDAIPVFPIKKDGTHMNWGLTADSLQYAIDNNCVRVSENNDNPYQKYNFMYVTMPSIKKALAGEYTIAGKRDDGTLIITLPGGIEHQKGTSWQKTAYDANTYGTQLLGKFLEKKRFPFPKSVYTVYDSLSVVLKNKPNALVLDFFAGSGTTLHAINLLNKTDNGNRRCVLVTNNELSVEEADSLRKKGFNHGDTEWESLGIAQYVTWPRIVGSITGKTVSGKLIDGKYGASEETFEIDEESAIVSKKTGKPLRNRVVYKKVKREVYPELSSFKISDGFNANAKFFKLGFLDKKSVAYGTQLEKLIPVLWMKAGSYGKCPAEAPNDKYMIYPENKFAILINTKYAYEFKQKLPKNIAVAYIITDYEPEYHDIANSLKVNTTYHLYRDYLDNFSINTGRI